MEGPKRSLATDCVLPAREKRTCADAYVSSETAEAYMLSFCEEGARMLMYGLLLFMDA